MNLTSIILTILLLPFTTTAMDDPLLTAIEQLDVESVEAYLKMHVPDLRKETFKTPPLHYVLQKKPCAESFAILKLLIDHGADVNNPCKVNGKAPLHVAVRNLNVNATQYLLEHGADPNAQNDWGSTPYKATHYLFLNFDPYDSTNLVYKRMIVRRLLIMYGSKFYSNDAVSSLEEAIITYESVDFMRQLFLQRLTPYSTTALQHAKAFAAGCCRTEVLSYLQSMHNAVPDEALVVVHGMLQKKSSSTNSTVCYLRLKNTQGSLLIFFLTIIRSARLSPESFLYYVPKEIMAHIFSYVIRTDIKTLISIDGEPFPQRQRVDSTNITPH